MSIYLQFLVVVLCASNTFYVFGGSLNDADNDKIIFLTDDKDDLDFFNFPISASPTSYSLGSDTTRMLLNQLHGFNLVIEHAQVPRINQLLTQRANICTSNRVKTKKRLQENIFSLPINIYSGLRLYYIKNKDIENKISALSADLLNDKGQLISLSALFSVLPHKILGISKGRSYGKTIDKQIEKLDNDNTFIRAGQQRYSAMVQMLFIKRFDFIIDFPIEVKKYMGPSNKNIALGSLGIAGSPENIVGYIACSKSELGKRFIAQVNESLKKLYKTKDYYLAHIKYLDISDVESFNRSYQAILKTPVPVYATQSTLKNN